MYEQFRRFGLTHAVLLIASAISLLPLIRIITVSLKPGDEIFSTEVEIFPKEVVWDNYYKVFFATDFFSWVGNSVVITALTALLSVVVSATAAYALSRYRFRLRMPMLIFLMSTQMVPVVMLLLPLYIMLSWFKLIDSYAGVLICYGVITFPFCIWILKGYFDTVPKSLEEAAQVDGLTEVGSFWKIVLPLSTPSLAIAGLFCVVQAWNEYIVARVILNSTEMYTWPLGIFQLQGEFETKWGMFAAASVAVTVPVLGVFLYSAKWLLKGLTLGGVKG